MKTKHLKAILDKNVSAAELVQSAFELLYIYFKISHCVICQGDVARNFLLEKHLNFSIFYNFGSNGSPIFVKSIRKNCIF